MVLHTAAFPKSHQNFTQLTDINQELMSCREEQRQQLQTPPNIIHLLTSVGLQLMITFAIDYTVDHR